MLARPIPGIPENNETVPVSRWPVRDITSHVFIILLKVLDVVIVLRDKLLEIELELLGGFL